MKSINKIILIALCSMFSFSSCKKEADLKTVDVLDVTRYQGTWYEIARFPNSFEKGLKCVTATYELKTDGKIQVINRGFSEKKGEFKEARGIARVPDTSDPGKLEVSFFRPFWGDYQIMEVGDEYEYALVGDPSRKYLWILCRKPVLDDSIYNDLTKTAQNQGFDIEILERITQDCW